MSQRSSRVALGDSFAALFFSSNDPKRWCVDDLETPLGGTQGCLHKQSGANHDSAQDDKQEGTFGTGQSFTDIKTLVLTPPSVATLLDTHVHQLINVDV